MNSSTKKWLFIKYSSAILIPFMIWFIVNLASILDMFLFFSSLTISEIFEDYIHVEKTKNVANKILFIFAIMIPLTTIISIFNLSK